MAESKQGWVLTNPADQKSWQYFENGAPVTNTWKQDSHGWAYLGANGEWVQNGHAMDSNGIQGIQNGYWTGKGASPYDYTGDATSMVNGVYDTQRQTMINNLARSQAGLDRQMTAANQNFNNRVKSQNLNNTLTKNNYNTSILGRGLEDSSIATSGLAGLDDKNTRLIGEIENDRTGALNGIEQQKTDAETEFNDNLAALEAKRQSDILEMARQMYQDDNSMYLDNQKLALDKLSTNSDIAYKNYIMNNGGGTPTKQPSSSGTKLNVDPSKVKQYMLAYGTDEETAKIGYSILTSVESQDSARATLNKYKQSGDISDAEYNTILRMINDEWWRYPKDTNTYNAKLTASKQQTSTAATTQTTPAQKAQATKDFYLSNTGLKNLNPFYR